MSVEGRERVLRLLDAVPLRLGATLLVPLFFLPAAHEIREAPRQHLVLLLAALAAAAAAGRGELARRLGWSGAAALAALGASVALAPSPLTSLFGAFPHSDSALALAASLLLVVAGPPRERLGQWCVALVGLAAGQALLAGAQALAGLPAVGTLGHPAFLGALAALAAPVAVGLGVDAPDRRSKAWAVAALVLVGVGLALAGRRVPLAVGVVGALAVAALSRRGRLGWGLVGGLVAAVAGALLLLPRSLGSDHAGVDARGDALRVAVEAARQRPIGGHGFGEFARLYAAGKRPELRAFEGRVHASAVELALGAGALGLVGMGVFCAAWLRRATRKARESSADRGRLLGVLAGVVGYGVVLQFHVEQPGVAVWAASLAGLVWFDAEPGGPRPPAWRARLAQAGLGLGALFTLVPLVGLLLLGSARQAAERGDVPAALARARQARAWLAPCRAELFESAVLRGLADPAASRRAAGELEQCLQRDPRATWVRLELGRTWLDLDEGSRAAAVLEAAETEAPSHLPTLRLLSEALVRAGRPEAALERLDTAGRLVPEDAGVWHARGRVLERLGRHEEAREAYRQAALGVGSRPGYLLDHERLAR